MVFTKAQVQIINPRRWWALALLGLLSIVVGILALAYTGVTLIALGLFFGINLIVVGTVWVMLTHEEGPRHSAHALRIVVGFLAILAGLFCLVHPGAGVLAILIAVAFWFVMVGVAELAEAVNEPGGRVLNAILGGLSIAVGILLVGDPDIGLRTIAVIAGIGFIVRGFVQVVAAGHLRAFA
jgi:uncharacterized membrane protein HdeD (DUF308 family)